MLELLLLLIFGFDGWQVIVELIVGLALCTWASMVVPGKFLSINLDSDKKRLVLFYQMSSMLSFKQ